jgi:hypothetical protein
MKARVTAARGTGLRYALFEFLVARRTPPKNFSCQAFFVNGITIRVGQDAGFKFDGFLTDAAGYAEVGFVAHDGTPDLPYDGKG